MEFCPKRGYVLMWLNIHFLRKSLLGLLKPVEAWRVWYVQFFEHPQDRFHVVVRESQMRHVVKNIQEKHLASW